MKRVGLIGTVVLALTMATAAVAASSGWRVQRSPNPAGAAYVQLYGVSCGSRSACTAVGQFSVDGSVYLALGERWNGTKWSIQQTRSPGATSNKLAAVSCASASSCMAVGSFQGGSTGKTLAERWTSHKWSIVHTPNPTGSPSSQLDGIACTSSKACTAVGSRQNGGTIQTLVERWNGRRWVIQKSPNPSHASLSFLTGVSCASRGACTAVGYWLPSSGPARRLAEHWSGKKWSIQDTGKLTGATSSELQGVSCSAPAACTAVGYYEKSANKARTLAERWNGKKWSIQRPVNPTTDPNKFLYAVSCSSARACTAVGYTSGPTVWQATLAEHWNGSGWTVQQSPHPGTDSQLQGLSCVATSTCTAVGWLSKDSGPQRTLVERR
jgi:hypothetical protein